MLHLSLTGRISTARAFALSCLIALGFVTASGGTSALAQTQEDHQTELVSADASGDLMEMDLIALRREVAQWSNSYAGPTAQRAKAHAATVHGIIDRLTIHKRTLQQSPQAAPTATAIQEVNRLQNVWPAWLMSDFDPPPALRTILVSNPEQLFAALEDAQPGDEIILADGIWKDLHLESASQSGGTAARPVVIRAQNPGQAVITAEFAECTAENIILRDLTFRGLVAHAANEQDSYIPSFAFRGNNVRISHCVFYAPQECGGIVLSAAGLRFDRNFVAGNFAGSAVRVNRNRCKLDGNYFGWRSHDVATSAAVEVLYAAEHATLRSNLFSGPGASVIDAGSNTLVEDNTFQNTSQGGLTINSQSRNAVVRNNMAFGVDNVEIASASSQFRNNYLERTGLNISTVGLSCNNTWIIDANGNDPEPASDYSVLPGPLNLVCTETEILSPRQPQIDNDLSAFDSEESTRGFQLMRDVLGYLRPHQDYGRLGFQGEALPLGRGSEVGPTWLPVDLSINRPLSRSFDTNRERALVAALDPAQQSAAATPEVFLNVAEAPRSSGAGSQAWTLQGWVHNRRGQLASGVIARADNGSDSWELSLTDDQRLVLSGETAGAAWSFSTESDYESEAGRSFFAVVVEPIDQGFDVCFYRGNEIESVDLIAVELAPADAFLGTSQLELIENNHPKSGLISARLFSSAELSEKALAVLNASDLESLRQADLLVQ